MTHRCHNREFLLKFALHRDGYRARLREHLPQFEVALLDYWEEGTYLWPCLCHIELNSLRRENGLEK